MQNFKQKKEKDLFKFNFKRNFLFKIKIFVLDLFVFHKIN